MRSPLLLVRLSEGLEEGCLLDGLVGLPGLWRTGLVLHTSFADEGVLYDFAGSKGQPLPYWRDAEDGRHASW